MTQLLQVRRGSAEDIDAAIKGWREAQSSRRDGRPLPTEHDDRVRGYLTKSDSFFVVADSHGQFVGMALGMQALEDDGAGPPIPGLCHISLLFVDPSQWGHGIGRLLMRDLLALARRRGYSGCQLWTQADNDRARRLYEGLGFRPSGREKNDDLGERVLHYALPEA